MILQQDLSKLPCLAEGGEGIIYEYSGNLIKKYKPCVDIKSKERKVNSLLNKTLPKEVIKPLDIVYDTNNKFVGYSMNKVVGEEIKKLSNKKFVTSNNITTKDIIGMLLKIKKVIEQLHNENIYIGDLNDQNILFDKSFNIFFIDCDSWSIDTEKCEVAMDLFKDPLLIDNNFNKDTDIYSYSILAWKTLTRIHPFGGTMNPDISVLERMQKGLSIIDNPKVKIPRTINSWCNLSPSLIKCFKDLFENKNRQAGNEIEELYSNLKFCDKDKEYYYGKFTTCPLCNKNAKIVIKPISQGIMSGLTLIEILDKTRIKTVINLHTYLDNKGYIVNVRSNKKVKYQYGTKYYFLSNDVLIEDFDDRFIIHSNEDYVIEKKFKTQIVNEENHIYYISKQNSFVDINVMDKGNSIKNICKCSNNTYFSVSNASYCLVNYYIGKVIVNIDGSNCEIPYDSDIINYGIHYDTVKDKWLIVLENSSGKYKTYIIDKNKITYQTDKIKYSCSLSSLCVSGNTIFIPIDGKIRGFAFEKDIYKDFECSVVDQDSILTRKGKKFIIINNENIYNLG